MHAIICDECPTSIRRSTNYPKNNRNFSVRNVSASHWENAALFVTVFSQRQMTDNVDNGKETNAINISLTLSS